MKDVHYDYQQSWTVDDDAAGRAFSFKYPYIDHGTGRSSAERYYDLDYAKLEWDRLWTRTWLCAGPAVDVSNPGDFFTFQIGSESIIVVRGKDGIVRAHYNVCSHRGTELVAAENGSLRRFTCPYHSWTFNLDGTLDRIRDPETFRPEALCERLDLQQVRCEIVAGLVFISMNEEIEAVRDYLGEIADQLEAYQLDKMKVIQHKVVELPANWKTVVDNFGEIYHIATLHPQLIPFQEDYRAQNDLLRNGSSRLLLMNGVPSCRYPDQQEINPALAFLLKSVGIDPESFKGSAKDVRRAMQVAKREQSDSLGVDYSRLTDLQLSDIVQYWIFPNTIFGLQPEAVYFLRILPHPSDPERCYYSSIILYRSDIKGATPQYMGLSPETNFDPTERVPVEHVPFGSSPGLGPVIDQDAEMLHRVQKGMHSRGFEGPLWGEQEVRLRHFHHELDRFLAAEK